MDGSEFWLQLLGILVAILLGTAPIIYTTSRNRKQDKKKEDTAFTELRTSVDIGHAKIFGKLEAIESGMADNSKDHDDLFTFKQYSLEKNLTKEDHDRLHQHN